ncbi:hypothetical protein OIU14_15365 [Thalassobacter stenotrophicus]|uniref:hypothetical protein n=1 Tax=Thalassobacter stenotrophicus TaxID=266809 RepID=UPI0022A9B207|nr:hypothetical protein [Thalassobacter stenotrophicus]UYP67827.1 hypothetical protein OIU14_15365 [Thalassobacter stenotrophicus]
MEKIHHIAKLVLFLAVYAACVYSLHLWNSSTPSDTAEVPFEINEKVYSHYEEWTHKASKYHEEYYDYNITYRTFMGEIVSVDVLVPEISESGNLRVRYNLYVPHDVQIVLSEDRAKQISEIWAIIWGLLGLVFIGMVRMLSFSGTSNPEEDAP